MKLRIELEIYGNNKGFATIQAEDGEELLTVEACISEKDQAVMEVDVEKLWLAMVNHHIKKNSRIGDYTCPGGTVS